MRGALSLVTYVWGLPQNLVGCLMWLAHGAPRETFSVAHVTRWRLTSGLSMGRFVFVGDDAPRELLVHEVGHCVQSLVLGPLYLPLVVVPSLVWAGLPALKRMRRRRHISYYSFCVERSANRLGTWLTGERAPR